MTESSAIALQDRQGAMQQPQRGHIGHRHQGSKSLKHPPDSERKPCALLSTSLMATAVWPWTSERDSADYSKTSPAIPGILTISSPARPLYPRQPQLCKWDSRSVSKPCACCHRSPTRARLFASGSTTERSASASSSKYRRASSTSAPNSPIQARLHGGGCWHPRRAHREPG